MSIDDTGLDAALRQWGDEQRETAGIPIAPLIADLLAGRHRHRNLTAIAASVVLVAAVASGLGFGLHLGTPPTATPAASSPHNTVTRIGDNDHRPCWQDFVDAGSRFDGHTGVVVFRYTGTIACTLAGTPHLALLNSGGTAVGAHRALASGRRTIVRSGDLIRFTVGIPEICNFGVPNGRYSLRINLRPATQQKVSTGVTLPIGMLRFILNAGCPLGAAAAANSTHVQVVDTQFAATVRSLIRIVNKDASDAGSTAVSAEAVRTTYAKAKGLLDSGVSPQTPQNTAVWLIQIHGQFICSICRGPNSGRPDGTVMTEIVRARSLRGYDYTFGGQQHDLSKLGTVVQLIP